MAFGPFPFTLTNGTTADATQVMADLNLLLNACNTLLASGTTIYRNYLTGLTLSNDGVTPNTVLDIAAGQAADSTNAAIIAPGAFTKSISSPWASGVGNGGMGNGLTATLNTWYHVILANNGGSPDYYFDTSATGANRPTGITDPLVRRIGSIKTDGSVHILPFTQVGDYFLWTTPVLDYTTANAPGSLTAQALSVPLGVRVMAVLQGSYGNAVPGAAAYVQDGTNIDAGGPTGYVVAGGATHAFGRFQLLTTTASQVYVGAASANTSLDVLTMGWIDRRGRDG